MNIEDADIGLRAIMVALGVERWREHEDGYVISDKILKAAV